MNLTDVCCVQEIDPTVNPTPCTLTSCNNCPNISIDTNVSYPFYFKYQIDPRGELFGKSQCGELNYTHYMMIFYQPLNIF